MTFTLDKYMPYTIGFDSFFNSLDSLTGTEIKGYPHYNIKKLNDNKWNIELALAGFSKNDIDIEVKDNVMTIHGELKSEDSDYVYKEINTYGLDVDIVVEAKMKEQAVLNKIKKLSYV